LHTKSLSQQAISLLHGAQYRVEIPPNVSQLCCGLAFASKGFPKSSEAKAAELEKQLIEASKRRQISRLCGCFSLHVTYENCVSFSSLQKNYI
jgi:D-lactate dehydrogenase